MDTKEPAINIIGINLISAETKNNIEGMIFPFAFNDIQKAELYIINLKSKFIFGDKINYEMIWTDGTIYSGTYLVDDPNCISISGQLIGSALFSTEFFYNDDKVFIKRLINGELSLKSIQKSSEVLH